MTKEERASRDADLKAREQPRLLWSSQNGTAIRITPSHGQSFYTCKPMVPKKSRARKLTEAEDNAIGRALRRRQNRRLRSSGIPHSNR